MSIEQKIDGLIKALENQTLAIQHSALVMASLIEQAKDESSTKKPRAKKETASPVVEAPVVKAPVVEAPVVEAPVVESPVVESPVVEVQREVSAEALRSEVIKLVGSLKTKLDENKYAAFTTRLKTVLYPSFKTATGPVSCLNDTNAMDDFGRGEFLNAVEKLVAEYAG